MKIIALIILLILAGGFGYWALFNPSNESNNAVLVKCIPVRRGPFTASVQATGRLLSRKTEVVKSLYGGIIADAGHENANYVELGALLASVTLPEEVRTKKEVELELAQLDLELITEQLLQSEELFKAKAVSEREVNELRIRKRKQEAQVENIHEDLIAKTIPAPFSGLLAEKRFHHGDRIGAGAELITLIDTSRIVVEARVHQIDLPRIHLSQEANLHSEIFTRSHVGQVVEISAMTERQNNTGWGEGISSFFKVHLKVAGLDPSELRIGAAVQVEIVLYDKPEAIAIPLECVQFEGRTISSSSRPVSYNPLMPFSARRRFPNNGDSEIDAGKAKIGRYVWMNENGVAVKRTIVTGEANESMVEVISGLQEDEVVAISGNREIAEGMKIGKAN